MERTRLTQLVKAEARDLGFELVGIAPSGPSPDLERFQHWLAQGYGAGMDYLSRRAAERAEPRLLYPEARSVIVLGANYFLQDLPASIRQDPSRGLIASYAWGYDYHGVLKPLLIRLDEVIRAASGRTSPGRAYVDTGPVLERSWATAAGLGFIGKNTCLIAPGLGSWLFLSVLLVPEEMAYDPPMRMANTRASTQRVGGEWRMVARPSEGQRPDWAGGETQATTTGPEKAHGWGIDSQDFKRATCGACTRCLDICPTTAFPSPHVLDARRCISYLTIELKGSIPSELRSAMGNWVFGCDLCQFVCPWNRRYARPTSLASLQSRFDTLAPRLLDLLALDEEGFRARFRRSPVQRAKRRGFLRNVCVALGNWGSPEAVPALADALQDREPLVRGHAAWALGRIGTLPAQKALMQCLASESDVYVKDEVERALAA